MILSTDLIALWRKALDEKWGYIWGTAGETWTRIKQDAADREQTIKWGSKWIGKRVADCSGLAVWAFKQLGGSMYHGSNTIWNKYVTGRCELKDGRRTDGADILPGDPVFLRRSGVDGYNRHHIGYYAGDGVCIEAKGTYYGVVTSPLSHWHETAHWLNVEYEGGLIFVSKPTLRKGDSGADVKKLQEMLLTYGLNLGDSGADGKFGQKTENAVRAFQFCCGLTADGICGDQTWAALDNGYTEPPVAVPNDSIIIPKAEWEKIKALINKY